MKTSEGDNYNSKNIENHEIIIDDYQRPIFNPITNPYSMDSNIY